MFDVQGQPDARNLSIDQVGVADLRYPITVLDKNHDKQRTVATIAMNVALPHEFKGTHMSRFIEVLEEHQGELTMRTLPAMLAALQHRLEAESARVRVEFPYFCRRLLP